MNEWNRRRLGKRDRFWLIVVVTVLAALLVLRWESHDGFADNGKPVWKSGDLGHSPAQHSVTVH